MENLDYIILASYFAIVLLIGIYSSKKKDSDLFLIANRKLNYWNLIATISAGLLGGGVLITYTAYVFEFGLSAIWFIFGISLGLLFFLLFFKKIKKVSDDNELYTISDYFHFNYGKNTGYLSAIVIFIWAFCLILMQFIAGGKLLSVITDFSYEWSVLIMGVIVLIYLILGGFNSVVKTDYFQYIIIIVFSFGLVYFLSDNITISSKQLSLGNMGIAQSVAFVIIGGFNIIVSADIWQRIFASKDTKNAKIGIIGSSAIVLIIGLALSVIGLLSKNLFPNINPDDALTIGISHLLTKGFLGVGLVLLFSVIMSTLDTMLFITSMNISNDIISYKWKISKAEKVKYTRYSIIILSILGTLIAIYIQNIISVGLALSGIGFSLIPSIIGSFKYKLSNIAVMISIILGVVSIIIVLLSGIIGPETSIISLPVALITLIIANKIIKH